MKKTDFPKALSDFLTVYLPSQRNFSKNTIASYCDTFKLLLSYMNTEKHIYADKIKFKQLNKECILSFLNWLIEKRGCSISTYNQRLSCIHTFFRFIQTDYPELLSDCQKIIGIPFRRKHTPCIQYLNSDDMKLLLSQPDASNKSGRRDQVLLSLMYDTGARVQEIADLTVSSIRLEAPAQITLIGKGRKARVVPLLKNTVSMLKEYLKENRLDSACKMQYPLFTNRCGNPLTRAGISYILKKYADMARAEQSLFPESITPHILRHSKAMHLLEAGVNIFYIRDILGHVNVSTTEVYARANMEMKRSALEKVSHISDNEVPSWTTNASLLDWLNSFGKSLN